MPKPFVLKIVNVVLNEKQVFGLGFDPQMSLFRKWLFGDGLLRLLAKISRKFAGMLLTV